MGCMLGKGQLLGRKDRGNYWIKQELSSIMSWSISELMERYPPPASLFTFLLSINFYTNHGLVNTFPDILVSRMCLVSRIWYINKLLQNSDHRKLYVSGPMQTLLASPRFCSSKSLGKGFWECLGNVGYAKSIPKDLKSSRQKLALASSRNLNLQYIYISSSFWKSSSCDLTFRFLP